MSGIIQEEQEVACGKENTIKVLRIILGVLAAVSLPIYGALFFFAFNSNMAEKFMGSYTWYLVIVGLISLPIMFLTLLISVWDASVAWYVKGKVNLTSFISALMSFPGAAMFVLALYSYFIARGPFWR